MFPIILDNFPPNKRGGHSLDALMLVSPGGFVTQFPVQERVLMGVVDPDETGDQGEVTVAVHLDVAIEGALREKVQFSWPASDNSSFVRLEKADLGLGAEREATRHSQGAFRCCGRMSIKRTFDPLPRFPWLM